jgi:hypothetical protein
VLFTLPSLQINTPDMNSQFTAIPYGFLAFTGLVTPKADKIEDLIAYFPARGDTRPAKHR